MVARWWLYPVALALVVSCASPPRREPPPARVRELARPRAAAVARVAGMAGDLVLEGGSVRALIGGMRRPPPDRGALLAIETVGAEPADDLVRIDPILVVFGRAHAIETLAVEPSDAIGRAAVRIAGRARIGARSVLVERFVAIADVDRVLSIETHVPDGGVSSVAERVRWGGQPPFAPYLGRVRARAWRRAPWIGSDARERGVAIGFRGGTALVRANDDPVAEHASVGSTDLAAPLGQTRRVRALVATSRDGSSDALRRLGWASGRPFPEATVGISHMPPRAAVRVRIADGRLWMRTRMARRGYMRVPLPHGTDPLTVQATAWGHAASDAAPLARAGRVRLEIPRAGRLRVRALDADTGEPIAFRLRVRGAGGTATPDLGPVYRASGARDVAVSQGGEIDVPLALGEYEITLTRGPEWSIDRRRVVVTGVSRTEPVVRMIRLVDPGEWVPCDFHLHAEPSPDSQVTLEDRVIALVAEGVRFAVPTDHNHVTDYGPQVEALGLSLGTVPGVEVSTYEPSLGHFNVFPFPLDPGLPGNGAPPFTGLTPASLFESLRAAAPGAVVQVNHPRHGMGIGYFDQTEHDPVAGTASELYSDAYDALEVWNGYDLMHPDRIERNLAEWMAMLSRGARRVATGNSDSHTIRNQLAGYPRTYVRVEGGEADPERLLASLRAGRAFVTNGPMIELAVEGRGPGETVEVPAGTVRATVTVRAPDWIDVSTVDVYVGDRVVETLVPPERGSRRRPPPPLRLSRSIELEIEGPTFVLAIARGERPMEYLFGRRDVRPLAFTNPVWIATTE